VRATSSEGDTSLNRSTRLERSASWSAKRVSALIAVARISGYSSSSARLRWDGIFFFERDAYDSMH
jgi:hypothetical protein